MSLSVVHRNLKTENGCVDLALISTPTTQNKHKARFRGIQRSPEEFRVCEDKRAWKEPRQEGVEGTQRPEVEGRVALPKCEVDIDQY
jgi:hypothetical protein